MTPTLSPVTPLTWFDAHFCLCECTLLPPKFPSHLQLCTPRCLVDACKVQRVKWTLNSRQCNQIFTLCLATNTHTQSYSPLRHTLHNTQHIWTDNYIVFDNSIWALCCKRSYSFYSMHVISAIMHTIMHTITKTDQGQFGVHYLAQRCLISFYLLSHSHCTLSTHTQNSNHMCHRDV